VGDLTISVEISLGERVRVYIYSLLPKEDRGLLHPVFQHIMDKDLPGELDRWLFCGAISGWDSAAPLQLSLQERGLAVAVQVQL